MDQNAFDNEVLALGKVVEPTYDKWRAEYRERVRKLLLMTIKLYVADLEENPHHFQGGVYYSSLNTTDESMPRHERMSAWSAEMDSFLGTYGAHEINQDMINIILQYSPFHVEDRMYSGGFHVSYKG